MTNFEVQPPLPSAEEEALVSAEAAEVPRTRDEKIEAARLEVAALFKEHSGYEAFDDSIVDLEELERCASVANDLLEDLDKKELEYYTQIHDPRFVRDLVKEGLMHYGKTTLVALAHFYKNLREVRAAQAYMGIAELPTAANDSESDESGQGNVDALPKAA
jgi:hypothetical protein